MKRYLVFCLVVMVGYISADTIQVNNTTSLNVYARVYYQKGSAYESSGNERAYEVMKTKMREMDRTSSKLGKDRTLVIAQHSESLSEKKPSNILASRNVGSTAGDSFFLVKDGDNYKILTLSEYKKTKK